MFFFFTLESLTDSTRIQVKVNCTSNAPGLTATKLRLPNRLKLLACLMPSRAYLARSLYLLSCSPVRTVCQPRKRTNAKSHSLTTHDTHLTYSQRQKLLLALTNDARTFSESPSPSHTQPYSTGGFSRQWCLLRAINFPSGCSGRDFSHFPSDRPESEFSCVKSGQEEEEEDQENWLPSHPMCCLVLPDGGEKKDLNFRPRPTE